MPVDGEPALPTPVTPDPVTPVVCEQAQPSVSPTARSDYPSQHGSAAAVDPSTTVVAPRAKTVEGPRQPKRSGTSAGAKPGRRSRSRSEEESVAGIAGAAGVNAHVQFLQAQAN